MRLAILAVLAVTTTALTGCFGGHYVVHEERGGVYVNHTVGPFAAAAIETQQRRRREFELAEARRSAATPLPEGTVLAGMTPPAQAPIRALPRAFEARRAREALAALALSDCPRLARRWLRARVVFAPSGRVEAALLDAPSVVEEDTRRCVHDRLVTASVPPFDGGPVTVGHTWFAAP